VGFVYFKYNESQAKINYLGNMTIGNGYWLNPNNSVVADVETVDNVLGNLDSNGFENINKQYEIYVKLEPVIKTINLTIPENYFKNGLFSATYSKGVLNNKVSINNIINLLKKENRISVSIGKSIKGINKEIFIKELIVGPNKNL